MRLFRLLLREASDVTFLLEDLVGLLLAGGVVVTVVNVAGGVMLLLLSVGTAAADVASFAPLILSSPGAGMPVAAGPGR